MTPCGRFDIEIIKHIVPEIHIYIEVPKIFYIAINLTYLDIQLQNYQNCSQSTLVIIDAYYASTVPVDMRPQKKIYHRFCGRHPPTYMVLVANEVELILASPLMFDNVTLMLAYSVIDIQVIQLYTLHKKNNRKQFYGTANLP